MCLKVSVAVSRDKSRQVSELKKKKFSKATSVSVIPCLSIRLLSLAIPVSCSHQSKVQAGVMKNQEEVVYQGHVSVIPQAIHIQTHTEPTQSPHITHT